MAVKRLLLQQANIVSGGGGVELPPVGSIALWSGTLANIPANWNLCDGTGVTPNLVARFLRGAPAATEPGTTGGADSHTHASMTSAGGHTHTAQSGGAAHTHTVNLAGVHDHDDVTYDVDGGEMPGLGCYRDVEAGMVHTTNSGGAAHTHTMDTTGAHTHAISTDDGRPPYYEVAFIQAGVGALVAVGLILIWTGTLASIPAGWSLCDGGDSRPDLRTTFVRGVNTAITDPGGVGGGATHLHTETAAAAHSHTENVSGAHTHTFNAYTWTHIHVLSYQKVQAGVIRSEPKQASPSHTHAVTNSATHAHNPLGNSATHHVGNTVNAASSLPVYYDVAYIINVAAASIPSNGVLVWTGLLANIPAGYNLCDGGDTRPELRGKFLRGSADGVDPGGEGGSDSHTHTDQNIGNHNDHTETSTGHQHDPTDTIGSHQHLPNARNFKGDADTCADNPDTAFGAHSHTFNVDAAHTHPSLTLAGDHNHNPWSTDEGRPAFYEVVFIMNV